MATVLQRIKDKRLTPAQKTESRAVFELATEGSETMTTKQLKMCLRALGFNVAKGEAQALVYEFDYTDSNTIDLADFQKIFLAKALEVSERDKFDQAFSVMSSEDVGKVSLRELSAALSATEGSEDGPDEVVSDGALDGNLLRHQMGHQFYDEEDSEAVHEFIDNASRATEELLVPKAALAAFLRV